MSQQRFASLAVLCGTLVLHGGVAAGLAGLGSSVIENGGAPIEVDTPRATATAKDGVDVVSIPDAVIVDTLLPEPREELPPMRVASASTPDPVQNDVKAAEPPTEAAEIGTGGALPDPREMLPPVRIVSLFTSNPMKEAPKPAVRSVETPNECLVVEICIDEYLWSLYERTPKVDTNKVTERIKATVKKKDKTQTVIKTITKYVVGDFTWKDPIAAQRVGMSVKDYVIGGMDRGFKLKLYHALRAMDDAGLMPGITSAFRDDYRQSITSGNAAATDRSYHGGSHRGGYGHGLAADLVSVKGETRLERYASSQGLWKWVDAREKNLGIGRPYLDRDPPHVGPIDGKEFADKRGAAQAKPAKLATDRRDPVAVGDHGRDETRSKNKIAENGKERGAAQEKPAKLATDRRDPVAVRDHGRDETRSKNKIAENGKERGAAQAKPAKLATDRRDPVAMRDHGRDETRSKNKIAENGKERGAAQAKPAKLATDRRDPVAVGDHGRDETRSKSKIAQSGKHLTRHRERNSDAAAGERAVYRGEQARRPTTHVNTPRAIASVE